MYLERELKLNKYLERERERERGALLPASVCFPPCIYTYHATPKSTLTLSRFTELPSLIQGDLI
jgi:hypothetical protein